MAEEDKVSLAFSYFDEFKANPDDPKFTSTSKKENVVENASSKRGYKEFNCGKKWHKLDRSPSTVTLSLIITCVAVFLLSGMGKNTELVGGFFISENWTGNFRNFYLAKFAVFTPIFLHFNFLTYLIQYVLAQ